MWPTSPNNFGYALYPLYAWKIKCITILQAVISSITTEIDNIAPLSKIGQVTILVMSVLYWKSYLIQAKPKYKLLLLNIHPVRFIFTHISRGYNVHTYPSGQNRALRSSVKFTEDHYIGLWGGSVGLVSPEMQSAWHLHLCDVFSNCGSKQATETQSHEGSQDHKFHTHPARSEICTLNM